jgi:hypothetical protein
MSQSPLYSPEMNEKSPRLPTLPPSTQTTSVEPPPPPPKPHRARKPKPTAAKAASADAANSSASGAASSSESGAPAATKGAPDEAGVAGTGPPEAKATTDQAKAGGDAPASASPIGELTAGSSSDAAETGRQTMELIRGTRSNLDAIRRSLSPDEKKTVAEIRTFLHRAEQALANGDVDGAHGLATKAKLLLDELTEK